MWVLFVSCGLWGAAEPAGPPRVSMSELTADPAARVGQEVEVVGHFRANSVGDDYLRVILLDPADHEAPQLDCMTKPSRSVQGLSTHEEIVVRGTVTDHDGRVRLTGCKRVVPDAAQDR